MPNPVTNERLRQILSSQSSLEDLFIIKALERILLELDPNAEDEILDEIIPDAPDTQLVLFGHKIGDYSGMNRATIIAKFGLTSGNVDDIFEALGVTQGTAGPGPMGATSPQKAAATKEDTSGESKGAVKQPVAKEPVKSGKVDVPKEKEAQKQEAAKKEEPKK